MRYSRVVVKSGPNRYEDLITLGNSVIVALTGNLVYVTPAVSLVNLQAAVKAVSDALAVWRPNSGRGTHSDLLDLRDKSLTLFNLLKSEADYVQLTASLAAGNDYSALASLLGTSGFAISGTPNPQGVLNPVTGFRRMMSSFLNPNQVKFNWNRPLDARKGNVYLYRVLRATTTNFANAVEIATTSRTSFIDTNPSGAVQTYTYWIVAVNNVGDGAASVAVTVSILG